MYGTYPLLLYLPFSPYFIQEFRRLALKNQSIETFEKEYTETFPAINETDYIKWLKEQYYHFALQFKHS